MEEVPPPYYYARVPMTGAGSMPLSGGGAQQERSDGSSGGQAGTVGINDPDVVKTNTTSQAGEGSSRTADAAPAVEDAGTASLESSAGEKRHQQG